MSLSSAWESNAAEWITWARAQAHDGFWEGTWPQLSQILPTTIDGPVVEVGSGEGRVGRKLMGLGHQVIGIERSTTLVRSSQAGDAPLVAVQADAASLPVATGATSTVVACMSLQDIDDLRGAVDEIARILRPGGHLCMAIVHPFSSAEDPATMHTHVPSVTQSYLESRQYTDRMEHDGLAMTFVSQHRPLSTYVNALADVGLLMRELREFGNKPIPWLLTARFEKLGS